mmetsp:Transcript_36172/g.78935  ORF Transcript_36172/g.78935 Transcript_36172/m.78935 type:complete len:412 (-) Transcript_36172:318-1553(-)
MLRSAATYPLAVLLASLSVVADLDEASAVRWADDAFTGKSSGAASELKAAQAATGLQDTDTTTCGGATLPWREISDKAKQKGVGTKADLLACMRDLSKCGLSAAKYARELPGVKKLIKMKPMTWEGMSKVRSCAIVGNAGHMLQFKYGSFVDNHDLVVRFNSLRTDKFSKKVGNKTTIRFLNHARSFATCKRGYSILPEGDDLKERGKQAELQVLLLWHPNNRAKAHECLQSKFQGAPRINSLSDAMAEEFRESMKLLRQDLETINFATGMKPEFAKELTSGAHAILLLNKFCREISIYGLSAYSPVTPDDTAYQYGGRGNLRSSGIRYHDWIMEALAWRVLNAARVINLCSVDDNKTVAPELASYKKPTRVPRASRTPAGGHAPPPKADAGKAKPSRKSNWKNTYVTPGR